MEMRSRRVAYIDLLRIFASFMVIVNHTNSQLFLEWTPSGTWFASVTYFFLSKSAVPLFLMIAGYNLLNKNDSYCKNGKRIIRMIIVLVVFSTFYYIIDIKNNPEFGLKDWLKVLLNGDVLFAYWYLYLYLALLVMLPFLQKMVSVLEQQDFLVYFGISGVFFSVLPIVKRYSNLQISSSFGLPLFGSYLCMLLIGYYFSKFYKPTRRGVLLAITLLVINIALSVGFTYIEYIRCKGVDYLYYDNIGLCFIMIESVCIFYIFGAIQLKGKVADIVTTLGKHTFGIYLLHMFFVEQMEFVLFWGNGVLHPLIRMVIYEVAVFVCSLGTTWVLRKIPVFKMLL